MKTRSLLGVTILLIVLTLGMSAGAVFAGSAGFSGTFAGDPTMPVVFGNTPTCTGQGVTPVRYDAYPFTVTATGSYSFTLTSVAPVSAYASFYIMNSSFNPAAAYPNCIAISNNGPVTSLTLNLTAATTYYLVIFDDATAQDTGGYSMSANGVGDFAGLPGSVVAPGAAACTTPLPSGSVIRNVPLGAPTYYEASIGARTTFDLPAGNWYVSQTSGDFAQVWIACQANLVWIPTTALGG